MRGISVDVLVLKYLLISNSPAAGRRDGDALLSAPLVTAFQPVSRPSVESSGPGPRLH